LRTHGVFNLAQTGPASHLRLSLPYNQLMVLPALLLALAQDSNQERGIEVVNNIEAVAQPAYARRHALVIGINAYKDPGYPDLGYAVADAEAVAAILIEDYGFAQKDVLLILNEDATKATIDKALEEWACDYDRIGEDDLLVVFFAGHGVTRDLRSRGDRGYLVPVDGAGSDGAHEWASLLGMNHLEDVSEAIPAKHVLFILDCCFGGLAVKRSPAPIAAGLSNRARQVITAGNADQAVLDAGGGGHSVFTGALLDALRGDADLDSDQVVTFGELFNHIGRDVERKTEMRQTPLQASFRDHEGGNVALFAPGVTPGTATAAERLKALERSEKERLAELERLSDYILVQDLADEAESLWPQGPEMVASYREWIVRGRELLERRSLHEASVRQVRQEAYLRQVVAGQVEEGEGTEPVWASVDGKLRWRFETFERLVEGLDGLQVTLADVEKRLEVSRTLRQVSIEAHAEAWEDGIAAIAEHPYYDGLNLAPQLGLVPLGSDPESSLWEFGHVLTGDVPQRGAGGALVRTEATGLVFVLIPGGTFWMGAQASDPEGQNFDPLAEADEDPVREVTLSPYFLSKYEMTQGQWERFVGEDPSGYEPGSDYGGTVTTRLHPVEQVSWHDCVRVLGRLDLVLPSEAQWEYGARAFADTPWSSGPEKESLAVAANLADAFAQANGGSPSWGYESWSDGYTVHGPVGSFAPNEFGLYDVHGNVWEWCLDGYDESFYGSGPAEDPVSHFVGSGPRLRRGGSFFTIAVRARSAFRLRSAPAYAVNDLGVRPARVITD